MKEEYKNMIEGFELYSGKKRPTGIGKRIRIARVTAGLTQSELAQKIGVTSAMISSWETGSRACTNVRTLERIAEALQTNPAALAGWL